MTLLFNYLGVKLTVLSNITLFLPTNQQFMYYFAWESQREKQGYNSDVPGCSGK